MNEFSPSNQTIDSKKSNIDWIGDIPLDWDLVPIRSIFGFRNEKNDPIKTQEILSLSIAKGVTLYSAEGRGGNKRKDDLTAYKIAHPNDIVLNSMNVIVGAVGLSNYYGAISPVYYALFSISDEIHVPFYEKVFLDKGFQSGLLKFGKGILIKLSGTGKLNTIRMKISQNDLKTLYFPKPPLIQQIAIAKFLDEKTAKIDEAIAIKEKQIELLKERKQILIQNAVTRGLDPNVPMKDSGIEWVGEVPEHWEVLPGRCFFKENKRKNIGLKEERVLSLSYGNIVIKPKEKLIGLVPESFETYQIVRPGDIIIRCTDLQNDKTSLRTGLAKNEGIITSAYLNLRTTGNNNSEYMHLFLHTLDITKEIYKYGSGLRQNLSFEDFKTLDLLKVPIEEQNQIVKHIKSNSKKISNALDHLQNQIEKLKEYKATLINSAVTGKIKVPQSFGSVT